MVPDIQILSLALIFMTVQILFAPVNNALGKPLVTMISSLGGAILFPAAFLIGAESGLIGIAWAWLVAAPLLLLLSARLTAPRLGLSLWQIARAMLPGLAPALVMSSEELSVGEECVRTGTSRGAHFHLKKHEATST